MIHERQIQNIKTVTDLEPSYRVSSKKVPKLFDE